MSYTTSSYGLSSRGREGYSTLARTPDYTSSYYGEGAGYVSRSATPPPGARGYGDYAPSPPRDSYYARPTSSVYETSSSYATPSPPSWSSRQTTTPSWLASYDSRSSSYDSPRSSTWSRPTLPTSSGAGTLIPAATGDNVNRYCIVFDLDETLCYARAGYPRARPGLQEVVSVAGSAEVVVWTAGEQHYAEGALRQTGVSHIVSHLVARDSRWYRDGGCTKDLRQLGRDLSRTLIVENTAQCVERNPENAILVPDFTGSTSDSVMLPLAEVLHGLLSSGRTPADYLRDSPLVVRRQVRAGSSGRVFSAYTLRDHVPDDCVDKAASYAMKPAARPASRGHYRPMRH